jgi:small-conductance mechanosensitive channel
LKEKGVRASIQFDEVGLMHRARSSRIKKFLLVATAVFILALAAGMAQTTSNAPPGIGEDIIPFLNQTLVWYGQLKTQQQLVNEPSDVLFLNDNRHIADQAVRLSFDFARAQAQLLAATNLSNAGRAPGTSSSGTPSSGTSSFQGLTDSAAKSDAQVKALQKELEGLHQQLAIATGKKRATLQATISETEGELELFQARRDILHTMLEFAHGSTTGNQGQLGLSAQIEEMARTVPGLAAENNNPEAGQSSGNAAGASAMAASAKDHKTPTGILALATDLFSLRHKLRVLDDNLQQTDSLAQAAKAVRAPMVAKVRELMKAGDDLAALPDSQDIKVLAQQRKDLDGFTAQFKHISAGILPLRKQSILLDVYRHNSANWREAIAGEYHTELRDLLLRLGMLAAALCLVLGISEIWRRATFRYITDVRRRYQFLLIRRFVLWCVIAIIVVTAFASELGALTTFAGLLTAGVAVSLQNVILSVAGYFFLIGKYGVRVGDRVQIAGVTGEVVDIGLVRLHLMEVGGGPGSRPTGRVVAFSNGVVFQANAGMFKQIPGTNFLWHEITLTLDLESDYRHVEERMLEAASKVLSEHEGKMEQQRQGMEKALTSVPTVPFAAATHLRLSAAGIEVTIRYPVELGNAAEIDDRITRELLDAMEREPKLRIVGSSGTSVRAAEQPLEPLKG